MQLTVGKWGNSLALRLPKHITDSVRLTEGQPVDVEVTDESLVIRPTRKRFKLADLLANEPKHEEVDWGKPVGQEEW